MKLDEFGILRCYGNAHVDVKTKNPKLFVALHQLYNLVIIKMQCRLVHAGVSHNGVIFGMSSGKDKQ